jgi:hypothetical protein
MYVCWHIQFQVVIVNETSKDYAASFTLGRIMWMHCWRGQKTCLPCLKVVQRNSGTCFHLMPSWDLNGTLFHVPCKPFRHKETLLLSFFQVQGYILLTKVTNPVTFPWKFEHTRKFSASYGTRKFIVVFTKAHYWIVTESIPQLHIACF